MPDPKQQALTQYIIRRSETEGQTADVIGEVLAKSADEALRKFFADPPRDEDSAAWYAATSVNHLRWRQVAAKVTTKFTEPEPAAHGEAEQAAAGKTEPLPV